jgi:primosomal protein N' (replication factor Y)
MQEHFPKIDIVLFDHTTATTHKKARELCEQFYGSKKGLLIGTHMALPYLHKPVDVTGVISYEAMRATPTWRVDEHTLSTLLTLREKTTKDLIVQIRTQKDEILSLAEKGLIDQFYEGEIEVRKALKYPPFAKFILCTFTGNPDHLKETQILIAARLGEHVQFYNAPQSAPGETIRYGLLRHTGTQKEYEDILLVSRSLPPYIKIEINPSRII